MRRMDRTNGSTGDLSEQEIADLHAALDDEYMARATYAQSARALR